MSGVQGTSGFSFVELLLSGGRAEQALSELDSLDEGIQSHLRAVALRAAALLKLGRREELAELAAATSHLSDEHHAILTYYDISFEVRKGRLAEALPRVSELAAGALSADLRADTWYLKGTCESGLGLYADAAHSFKQAMAHFECARKPAKLARSLIAVGVCEQQRMNFEMARLCYGRARDLSYEVGALSENAYASQNLGTCLLLLGRFRGATAEFENARAVATEIGRKNGIYSADLGLGLALLRSGRLALAEERIRAALRLATEAGDIRSRAIALEYLGEVRLGQAEFAKARNFFRKAARLGASISDPEVQFEAQYRWAEAELALGRPAKAQRLAEEAKERFTTMENLIEVATARRISAQAAMCERRWKDAREELRLSLETLQSLDERFEIERVRRLLDAAREKVPVADVRANERAAWGVSATSRSRKPVNSWLLDDAQLICGQSQTFLRFLDDVDRKARGSANVLIEGETGSGKELVARRLHSRSERSAGSFVPFNCGTTTPELFDAEVFGHLKGAFTGAANDRPGLARIAHQGTLFLDEIGEMSKETQARMLRLLDNGEVRPVGSDVIERTDLRVVAATHQDLESMIVEERFRHDLFYRLATIRLRVPPLRERIEDLDLLLRHFFAEARTSGVGNPIGISDHVLAKMSNYSWPGNIRELRNEAFRLAVAFDGQRITSWKPNGRRLASASPKSVDRDQMMALLAEAEGSVTVVSDRLGMTRPAVYRLLKKWEIPLDDFRRK